MPASQPADTDHSTSNGDAREQTLASLRPYIVRTFRRSFRGYDREAVNHHLELILGWLSFTGVDALIRERFNEQDPVTRQFRTQAEHDVEQVREEARTEANRRIEGAEAEARRVLKAAHGEAETVKARARDEAARLLADAHADAALARQGRLARMLHRH